MRRAFTDKKIALLISGGLDSTVAYYYALNQGYRAEQIVPLWFDLGQPYARKEEAVIDALPFGREVRKMHLDLIREEFGNVPGTEDGSQIIPGRNLIMATIAASFAGEVWLMALDGEMHRYAKERDKSVKFFEDTSALLTYVFNILRPETKVTTPFASMTKTEVVRWALNNGVDQKVLLQTSTCYHPTLRNCGSCPTCFKRWVAMSNNGIQEEYVVSPVALVEQKGSWQRQYVQTLQRAKSSGDYAHYSLKRVVETLTAVRRALGYRPEDRDFDLDILAD